MAIQTTRTIAGPLATGKVNKREAGVLEFASQIASVIWNHTRDGGAVGTLSLGTALPANAVITRAWADVQTAATSGGSATFSLVAGSTTVLAATAFDNANNGINVVGVQTLKNDAVGSGFEALKVAASSELKLVIAGAALTAGKVRLAVEFYISK